jgi:hypothetical protein
VFPLSSAGLFATTPDAVVYEGLNFEGSRVFEITPAEMREIINYGDGRVRDSIYLPPNVSVKGELRVGYEHQDINAALTGVSQIVTGEKTSVPMSTDQQGTEPIVSLLLMQQAKDENKLKRWRYYIVPRAQAFPMPSSFNESATEIRYQITFNPSSVRLWNEALTVGSHGCTELAYESGMAEGRPNIVMFEGDGVYDVVFSLPTDKQATDTAKMTVHNLTTGVAVTTGITKAVGSVTFDAAPTYPFAVFYEY